MTARSGIRQRTSDIVLTWSLWATFSLSKAASCSSAVARIGPAQTNRLGRPTAFVRASSSRSSQSGEGLFPGFFPDETGCPRGCPGLLPPSPIRRKRHGRDGVRDCADEGGRNVRNTHAPRLQFLRKVDEHRLKSAHSSPYAGFSTHYHWGLSATTSPAIQQRPSVSRCSRPTVAINCIPTQTPRNGTLPLWARSSSTSTMPVAASRPPAAIGEGADAGQDDTVGFAHDLSVAADNDLFARCLSGTSAETPFQRTVDCPIRSR